MACKLEFEDQLYNLNNRMGKVRKKLSEKLTLKEINVLCDEVEAILDVAYKELSLANKKLSTTTVLKDGEELFDDLERLRKKIWENDQKFLFELNKIESKIDSLSSQTFFHSPQENEEKLHSLYGTLKSFSESHGKKSYRLDQAIDKGFQKISNIYFELTFPIFSELNEESYLKNFIQKMKEIKEYFILDREKGLFHFMKLSSKQREEIYYSLGKLKGSEDTRKGIDFFHDEKTSNFEKAAAVELFLQELLKIAEIAKELLYKDENLALFQIQNLDTKTQSKIDTLLNNRSEKADAKKVLAEALMKVVTERVIG